VVFRASKAFRLQVEMSKKVVVAPLDLGKVRVVGGLDVAYVGDTGFGVAVAVERGSGRIIDVSVVAAAVEIPYIPGLLAFREAPLMISALKLLIERGAEPDVVMVNGHGLPHPRRLGIASHVGVALDIPTIGIARRRLYGVVRRLSDDLAELVVDGEVVGYVIGRGRRELYISVGHRVEPRQALELARELLRPGDRYPLPIQYADAISKSVARCARGEAKGKGH